MKRTSLLISTFLLACGGNHPPTPTTSDDLATSGPSSDADLSVVADLGVGETDMSGAVDTDMSVPLQPVVSCPCWEGNGDYCGRSVGSYAKTHACSALSGQDGNILLCKNSIWTVHKTCDNGCIIAPNGVSDYCRPPVNDGGTHPLPAIQTVFMILMENHNWNQLAGSASAPYLNQTLIPMASYTKQYFSPPSLHPSEPNYIWLEAGTNFGIRDDGDPSAHNLSSHDHLVALLDKAGASWKAWQEDIAPGTCPVASGGLYAAKHDPFVFFTDVTADASYCTSHVRSFVDLDAALADTGTNQFARYNFITPNLCHDMHDANAAECGNANEIAVGDAWLANYVPKIIASKAYQAGNAAIFITWDEDEPQSCPTAGLDCPIGFLAISPLARGGGYSNSLYYTHSSTLLTLQEIFGVAQTPLGDAVNATDLSDLFK